MFKQLCTITEFTKAEADKSFASCTHYLQLNLIFQLIWIILFLVKRLKWTAKSFTLPDFSLKWSRKPRRDKDARRHICFTPQLPTLSSLQHLLAYMCDYQTLLMSSNRFSFFKCSLLPGVELSTCASTDIMSPFSPCTNRVSNTLTIHATRTRCGEQQDKEAAAVHFNINIPVHALNMAHFAART